MGDVISLEPLIRTLRRAAVEIRISAQARWHQLYPEFVQSRWLDAEIPWTSYDSSQKYRRTFILNRSFREYLRRLRDLGNGAVGIDPRGDIRSVLLLHLARCRRVLTLKNYLGTDLRVPRSAAEILDYPDDLKRWEVNLLFLKFLGIDTPSSCSPPQFDHLSPAGNAVKQRRIGLVPVAPWSGKLWGRSKWTELAAGLSTQGWEAVGLCGPGQSPAARAEMGENIPVEECSDVRLWANELGACRCLITVDSGPMHLAAALGIPVIALFGQGKLPLWAPSGRNSRVITHQDDPDFFLCHPIEVNAHFGKSFMARIVVSEVFAALQSLTAQTPVDRYHPDFQSGFST
jgi:ADP-heptose:LPS heptosyltransferase